MPRHKKEVVINQEQPPINPVITPNPNQEMLNAYNIIDQSVKQLISQMPVDKFEVIYRMELEKQSNIHLALLVVGFALIIIIVVLSL